MAHLLIGLSSVIFLPKQVSRSKIMIILYQATEKSVPSKDKYHTSHITVQHCPGTIRRKNMDGRGKSASACPSSRFSPTRVLDDSTQWYSVEQTVVSLSTGI